MNAERVRPDDLIVEQRVVEQFYGARELQCELVERGTGERELDAGNLQQLGLREAGLRKILMRLLANAFFADQAKVNRGGEGVQSFVGTDVGRSLLAADVLLARGESEHEASAAFGVRRLSGEASGHLADKFVARGDHANERSAVARRNAECLAFHRDDVGFGGQLNESEPDGFGDRGVEQRATRMRYTGKRWNVFEHAEEIRRLHDDCRGLREFFLGELRAIDLAGLGEANFFYFEADAFRVRVRDLAVFRMNRTRDQHGVATGDALGHQDGFGERG